MRYTQNISLSLRQYWQNKSLLFVLLLEFVARTLAVALFIAIDIIILMAINDVQLLASGMPDISSFMNMRTYIVLTLLLILQFIGILYISSFFSAGFFGMLKNLVQDGSTAFEEFMPNANRYWYPTFRYLAPPYLLTLLGLLPFTYYYGVASMVAAFGGVFDASVLSYLALTLGFAFLVTVLVMFWFSYGPAIIVFDDADAWPAMKESFRLAKRRAGATARMVIICLFILGIAFAAYFAVNFSFAFLTRGIDSSWVRSAAGIIELLLNVLIISAGVVAGIFIFLTYEDLTVRKQARRAPTRMPMHRIKRKG